VKAYRSRALLRFSLKKINDALQDYDRAVEITTGPLRREIRWDRFRLLGPVMPHDHAVAEAHDLEASGEPDAAGLYALAVVHAASAVSVASDKRLTEAPRNHLAREYADDALRCLVRTRKAGYFDEPVKLTEFQNDPGFRYLSFFHAGFQQFRTELLASLGPAQKK